MHGPGVCPSSPLSWAGAVSWSPIVSSLQPKYVSHAISLNCRTCCTGFLPIGTFEPRSLVVNIAAVQQKHDLKMSIRQRCMHAHYFQIYVREFDWLEP